MNNNERIRKAIEYMQQVAMTDSNSLEAEIKRTVGEDFAQFMDTYARAVLGSSPESAGSLMLMGYMLRAHEETRGINFMMKGASA